MAWKRVDQEDDVPTRNEIDASTEASREQRVGWN